MSHGFQQCQNLGAIIFENCVDSIFVALTCEKVYVSFALKRYIYNKKKHIGSTSSWQLLQNGHKSGVPKMLTQHCS